MTQLAIVLSAGLASALLLAVMLKTGRVGALDNPNHRSLHVRPVPRSGGIGILLAAGIGLTGRSVEVMLIIAVSMLAIVSWIDDQRSLPVTVRFISHFLAAAIIARAGLLPDVHWLVLTIMVLGIVWMTNLYNFMDGVDGLAGGMALFGFSAYAAGGTFATSDMAFLSACIAAGAAAFLLFNFEPAKIFMGDVGSIPLGFLAAVLGLMGVAQNVWPVWFPLLIFSPFIVDSTVTLAKRALRRERIWQAHREHYYQRLIRMGWSHRQLTLYAYGLMLATDASGLALLRLAEEWQALGVVLWGTIYLFLMLRVDRAWRLAAVK